MNAFFLLVMLAQDPPPATSIVGLVGHWKGDGDGADASGRGFTGTGTGGFKPSTEAAPLKTPNPGSFGFDGASGVVSIPDAPLLRLTGDLTLSFWKRKTANNADWVRIVGKGNGGQRTFGLWEFPGDGGQLKFQIYNQNGGSILELDSPGMTSINVWHHVLVSISVTAASMWVDGRPVAQGTKNGDPGSSADPVTFGHAGYHSFFAGQVDDVRLYNRALSAGEIAYLAAGHGAPEAPTELKSADGLLTWKATSTPPPAGTQTFYSVKRSAVSGKDFTTVGWGIVGTSFPAPPAPQGPCFYVVTATNTGGESPPSPELGARN
jgi:hypothetical protein